MSGRFSTTNGTLARVKLLSLLPHCTNGFNRARSSANVIVPEGVRPGKGAVVAAGAVVAGTPPESSICATKRPAAEPDSMKVNVNFRATRFFKRHIAP